MKNKQNLYVTYEVNKNDVPNELKKFKNITNQITIEFDINSNIRILNILDFVQKYVGNNKILQISFFDTDE